MKETNQNEAKYTNSKCLKCTLNPGPSHKSSHDAVAMAENVINAGCFYGFQLP